MQHFPCQERESPPRGDPQPQRPLAGGRPCHGCRTYRPTRPGPWRVRPWGNSRTNP